MTKDYEPDSATRIARLTQQLDQTRRSLELADLRTQLCELRLTGLTEQMVMLQKRGSLQTLMLMSALQQLFPNTPASTLTKLISQSDEFREIVALNDEQEETARAYGAKIKELVTAYSQGRSVDSEVRREEAQQMPPPITGLDPELRMVLRMVRASDSKGRTARHLH